MRKKQKNQILRVLYWIVFVFFIWLVYRNIEDYSALVETFKRADWILLGYASLIGLGNLLIYSLIFESSFKVVSDIKKFPRYFQEVLISYFLSLTTPLGTTGGNAYMITYLRGLGFSSLRSVFAIIAASLSNLTIFIALLTISLRYLNSENQLSVYQVSATVGLLFYASIPASIMAGVLILPSFSIKFARFIAKVLNWMPNRFAGQNFIEEKKIDKYSEEVSSMSANFDKSIIKFIDTLKFSSAFHLLNILILFLVFLSYGVTLPITAVIMIYSVIMLFSVISPTPQGIGIAEGLSHLAAVSVGISGSSSLIAILTFRILTIWLPTLLGFLIFRKKVNSSTVR